QPIRVPDQTFISEAELLAAGANSDALFLHIAQFNVGLAQIHRILIRRHSWILILPEDVRILPLESEPEPSCRKQRHVDPKTAEEIGVFAIRFKSSANVTFHACAILGPYAQPFWELTFEVIR